MRSLVALLLLCTAASAQTIEPRYLVGPLQAQRDKAANDAAICGAEVARLNEMIARLQAELDSSKKKD